MIHKQPQIFGSEFWSVRWASPLPGQLPSNIARPRKAGAEFQEEKKGVLMREGGRGKEPGRALE